MLPPECALCVRCVCAVTHTLCRQVDLTMGKHFVKLTREAYGKVAELHRRNGEGSPTAHTVRRGAYGGNP